MPLTIAGIGNRLSRDDAIGLLLVQALSEKLQLTLQGDDSCVDARIAIRGTCPVRATLWEGVDALAMASELLELDGPALIVDCADMGLQPGQWRAFSVDQCLLAIKSSSVSVHGLGMAEALEIARGLGLSHSVTVFGVQPFDLSPQHGLTPEMAERFDELLDALILTIGNLEIDIAALVGEIGFETAVMS